MVSSKQRRGIILDRDNRIVTHFDAVCDSMKLLTAAMGKVLTSLNTYMTGYSVNLNNILRWYSIEDAVKARYTSFIWIGLVDEIPCFTAEIFEVQRISEVFQSSRTPDRLFRKPRRTRTIIPVKEDSDDDISEVHWGRVEDRNSTLEAREAKLALLIVKTEAKVLSKQYKIIEYDEDEDIVVLQLR